MAEILPEYFTEEIPNVRSILGKSRVSADHHTKAGFKILKREGSVPSPDRPGWIPPEITRDWDTNPYAYQTEEELMPAGGMHGELLTYITEILRDFLKQKGLRFLADTFMIYRDRQGIRQRIAPDLMFIPYCDPAPSAYDLDTEPIPIALAEITSPKSLLKDTDRKVTFYEGLGITVYLVIDQITSGGVPREQIGLYLWRKVRGRLREIRPDADGWLALPEIGVKVRAEGRNPVFAEIETGEILYDNGQQRQRAEFLAEKLRDLGISV